MNIELSRKQIITRMILALIAVILIIVFTLNTGSLKYVYNNVPPEVLTFLLVYIVLMKPQADAQFALKIVQEKQVDKYATVQNDLFNWLPIYNDFQLVKKFFGSDNLFKKIIGWGNIVSLCLLIISLLYFNGLVIMAPQIVDVMAIIQLVSLVYYVVSKSIIVGYFINMFAGWGRVLTAIVFPLGFIVLTSAIKLYITGLDDAHRDEAMGYDGE